MRITITDNTKSISIERRKKQTLVKMVNDFLRLLKAYGFTNKEILKVIKKKDKYVTKLEKRIQELETKLYKKDIVFQLHEGQK